MHHAVYQRVVSPYQRRPIHCLRLVGELGWGWVLGLISFHFHGSLTSLSEASLSRGHLTFYVLPHRDMTSVSAGHIILRPHKSVGAGARSGGRTHDLLTRTCTLCRLSYRTPCWVLKKQTDCLPFSICPSIKLGLYAICFLYRPTLYQPQPFCLIFNSLPKLSVEPKLLAL